MTFTVTDTIANAFSSAEVSLKVYAFTPDAFGGNVPNPYTAPVVALAAASATADGAGKFAITGLVYEEPYHLAAQSALNPTTWYWNYSHAIDGGDPVPDTTTGQHILAGAIGSTPTIGVLAGDGTSPPTPTVVGTDTRGVVKFGSGSSPAAGGAVTVTFNKAYAAAPVVQLIPGNAATQALGLSYTSSTTAFTIVCTSAPTASQGATIYNVGYFVIG